MAIFSVILVHSAQTTLSISNINASNSFFRLAVYGKYGVELFFVLSGWLLASIYGFKKSKIGKSYFLRRLARIYPLWVVFLFLSIVQFEFTNSGGWSAGRTNVVGESAFLHSNWGIILVTLTFTLWLSSSLPNQIIPGSWSINAEIFHYLLFPFMRKFSYNHLFNILSVINILTITLIEFRQVISNHSWILAKCLDAYIRTGIYSTVGFFCLGVVIFVFSENYKSTRNLSLAFQMLKFNKTNLIIYPITFLIIPCPFGFQLEAIGYLVTICIISIGISRGVIFSSIFKTLGKYSYFIYFMHFLVLSAIRHFATKNYFPNYPELNNPILLLFVVLLVVAVSLILAIPSFKYFEKPFIKFAHK